MAKKKNRRQKQKPARKTSREDWLLNNLERTIPSDNPSKSTMKLRGTCAMPNITVRRSKIGGPHHKDETAPNYAMANPGKTEPKFQQAGTVDYFGSPMAVIPIAGAAPDMENFVPIAVRRDELAADYNTELLKRGYGWSREQLENDFDLIDMRAAFPKQPNNHDIAESSLYDSAHSEYEQKVGPFAAAVPCFNEGVLQLNTDRYIYFRVTELDIDRQLIRVFVHDHMFWGCWTPGMSGEIGFVHTHDKRIVTDNDKPDKILFPKLYRMIKPEKFPEWTETDREIWENEAITVADSLDKTTAAQGYSALSVLAMRFFWAISLCNCLMSQNKMKTQKPKAGEKAKQVKRSDEELEALRAAGAPARVTRVIGPVRTRSQERPRVMTERKAAFYRIPKWTQAGHWRYYRKTGKRVWIEPQIKTRKALKGADSKPPVKTTLTAREPYETLKKGGEPDGKA